MAHPWDMGWAVELSLSEGLLPPLVCVCGVGGLRLRPLFACFVPSIAVPSRAVPVALDQSIYRPFFPNSPSLPSPMMKRTLTIMAMLARLARVRH